MDDPVQQVQNWLDDVAQRHGYRDIVTACSYATSTNGTWAAEAQQFVEWRDKVWEAFFKIAPPITLAALPQPEINAA